MHTIIQMTFIIHNFTMVKNHPTCASQMKERKNLKVPHPMRNTQSPPPLCTGAILLIIGATSNDVNAIPHRSGRHITSLHWHGCFGHPLMGVGCIINHKTLTCHTGNASSCEQCLVSHGDGSDVSDTFRRIKYLSWRSCKKHAKTSTRNICQQGLWSALENFWSIEVATGPLQVVLEQWLR